jgi:outer membrane protein OmpA-like peptidoglycan-associated protein
MLMRGGFASTAFLAAMLGLAATPAWADDAAATANSAEPCPLVQHHPFQYRVYFPSGEEQWNADYDRTLEVAAEVAVTESEAKPGRCQPRFTGLTVTGHSDTTGISMDAMILSRFRVNAVVVKLVELGVPIGLIEIHAMGDLELPVATADETVEPLNNVVIIDFEYE